MFAMLQTKKNFWLKEANDEQGQKLNKVEPAEKERQIKYKIN